MSSSSKLFRAVFCLGPCFLACTSEDPTSGGTGGVATGGTAGAVAGGGSGGTNAGTGAGGTSGSPSGGTAGSATGGSSGSTSGGAGAGGMSGGGGAGQGGAGDGGAAGAGSGGMPGGAGGAGGASGAGGAGGGGKGGASGAGGGGKGGSGGSGGGGTFTLTSPALPSMPGCGPMAMASMCPRFPNENISFMQQMNISPELSWTGAPAGTMSFALVLQDLSNGFAHWVLWNIPASTTMLPANIDKSDATPPVPAGSQQCNNSTGEGYFGPGSECNVYEFVLYALSMPTFSPNQSTMATSVRMQLQNLGNQILGQASLRGRSNFNMTCNP